MSDIIELDMSETSTLSDISKLLMERNVRHGLWIVLMSHHCISSNEERYISTVWVNPLILAMNNVITLSAPSKD